MNYRLYLFAALGLVLLTSLRHVDGVYAQQEDFRVFKSTLLSKEGTLDMHLEQDSINYYLEILGDKLANHQSDLEEYKLFSEMIARLDCGHTQVIANRSVQAEWLLEKNALPIDMYLVGRRLVVGQIVPADYENVARDGLPKSEHQHIPAGSEILEIDEYTVPEMMEHMGRYISSDEGSMDFKYFQAAKLFEFYRHMALPFTKDSIPVKYVTPTYDTTVVYFEPGKAPIHSMNVRLAEWSNEYKEGEADMGKFKVVNDKYGYFRFKSFSASAGKDYEAFLKESFQEMKDKKIRRLVVDLRGNTGGVMQYEFIKYFVGADVNIGRYVIAKPFKKRDNQYIRKVHPSFFRYAVLSWSQKHKIKKGSFDNGTIYTEDIDEDLVYDGEVCVITDEGTFSSAAILSCQLKTLADAKIVGRPAGGSFYSGNAGTLIVHLPESGLEISVNPNTFYSHLERVDDPTAIKQPDVYLDPLILDAENRKQFYFKEAIAVFQD